MTDFAAEHEPLDVARKKRRIARAEREEAGVRIGSFGGFEVAYRLDSADEDVIGHSFEQDIFLAAVPDYRLPDDGVVLDVGAHIGTLSLLTARMAPKGRVIAIEASRETADLLRINVALNDLGHISAHHAALGAEDGTVHLHHDPSGTWGHTIMQAMSEHSEAVPSMRLRTLLAQEKVARVDLAKFNCEGADLADLALFSKMIVLYHEDLVPGRSHTELLERLADAGHRTEVRDVWGQRGWIIATRS